MERHRRRHHPDAVFACRPVQPLSADARGVLRSRLLLLRRSRHLTPMMHDMALTLLRCVGPDGRCDPSHGTIARLNGDGSERTAERTTAALRRLGLLSAEHRVVRVAASPWRTKPTSNAYAWIASRSWRPPPVSPRRTGRQSGGGVLESKTPLRFPAAARPPALTVEQQIAYCLAWADEDRARGAARAPPGGAGPPR